MRNMKQGYYMKEVEIMKKTEIWIDHKIYF